MAHKIAQILGYDSTWKERERARRENRRMAAAERSELWAQVRPIYYGVLLAFGMWSVVVGVIVAVVLTQP